MATSVDKLNILDFSPGIRAKDINENFDLIKKWIQSERLRLGGWGLVEGFDLTKDLSDFSITVSDGVMINEDGEEVHVDGTKLIAGPPTYRNMVEELEVGENGQIVLQFAPYSNTYKHTVTYDPPNFTDYDQEELYITNLETSSRLSLRDIKFVDENIIIVNSEYVGKKVRVNYLYANDRIDGILIKKDGSEYTYELGIISTSPTQQVIQDYMNAGYYLIGFAYWFVGKKIDVRFITGDRSLRPIYIDKNGIIHFYGKPYTGEKFIYFIEPEYPQENDLWYDIENEILYIWRPDEKGKYSWVPVNDLSRFNREYGVFTEEEMPDDLQSFTFEDKANLRFVPGHNQLTIIIDQVVIMRDQFEELFDDSLYDEDACTGYGFRLKDPLERPSRVEVYVDHSINTKGQKLELFPHITSFLNVQSLVVDDENITKIVLESEYEIGNHQLEVWLNGRYLRLQEEFAEMTKDYIDVSIDNNGELSNVFKILAPINQGDIITYKVTRQMATYDNLRKVTDALNNKVDDAVNDLNQTKEDLQETIKNTSTTLDDLKVRVKSNEENIKGLGEGKISKVTIQSLQPEVKNKIVRGATYFIQNLISGEITLPNLKETDFLSVYYIDNMTTRFILIRDEDYVVVKKETGISLELDTKWLGNDEAKIYIEALLVGIE